MPARQTQEMFIERAKQIHGEKYDYSLVQYVNAVSKVKILCKKHGIFEQGPDSHTNKKAGCPKCTGKLTNQEFVELAKNKYGDIYDYSKTDYDGKHKKIIIICPVHGEFKQTPNNHLYNKVGCSKCGGTAKLDSDIFIEKAKNIHGNKYDYSLVEYVNNKINVKIVCSEHGIFEQPPGRHLIGSGCIKCSGRYSYTSKEFIEKSQLIHDYKYNYSLVDYKKSNIKVKIICPDHGVFKQNPGTHLYGVGCPICCESKGEKQVAQYLSTEGFIFEREKTFQNCKNERVLSFDFYLIGKNILIEYDGIQHFEPLKHYGGKEYLLYIQKNDEIKNKYCNENNIKLIRIRYDENVEEALKKCLL